MAEGSQPTTAGLSPEELKEQLDQIVLSMQRLAGSCEDSSGGPAAAAA